MKINWKQAIKEELFIYKENEFMQSLILLAIVIFLSTVGIVGLTSSYAQTQTPTAFIIIMISGLVMMLSIYITTKVRGFLSIISATYILTLILACKETISFDIAEWIFNTVLIGLWAAFLIVRISEKMKGTKMLMDRTLKEIQKNNEISYKTFTIFWILTGISGAFQTPLTTFLGVTTILLFIQCRYAAYLITIKRKKKEWKVKEIYYSPKK